MKYIIHILFLLAGLLVSCGQPTSYPEELVKADSLLSLDPSQADNALFLLECFEAKKADLPESVRMFCNLLKIKAEDKCFVEHRSDSVMLQIVHYYEKESNNKQLAESYYYLGSVYRDMQDTPRALEAFQHSLDLSSKDYHLIGRTYNQMGMLLGYQSLYEAALPMLDSAKYYYQQINDQSGIIFALRDIGRMYDMLHKQDSAELYYRKSYDRAVVLNDRSLLDHPGNELANTYIEWNKLDSAKIIFSCLEGFENEAIYLQGLGFLKLEEHDIDSAYYYFQSALKPGRENQNLSLRQVVNHELAKIEAAKGNYRSAWDYEQISRHWADSIKRVTRAETVGRIHALYNYQHIEKKNQQLLMKQTHDRLKFIGIVCVFLWFAIVGALWGIYIMYKRRIMQEQYQRALTAKETLYQKSQQRIYDNRREIDRLKQVIEASNVENDKLRTLKAQLEKEILEMENQQIQIAQEEQLHKEKQIRKSAIYQWFAKQSQQNEMVPEDDKHWQMLYAELDETYNHFTQRLQELCPNIKIRELRTCCCLKLGFHPAEIAIFFNITVQAISNIRQRLFSKIQGRKGKAEDLDTFIAEF